MLAPAAPDGNLLLQYAPTSRLELRQIWHLLRKGLDRGLLDSLAVWRVGFSLRRRGGESVLVNGAAFKTVSETVRTGSGRFDSYTPPPADDGQNSSFTRKFLT